MHSCVNKHLQLMGVEDVGEPVHRGGDYYNLVRYTCVPQIKLISQADGVSLESQYWQQDGATVHRTVKVLRYLDGQFGEGMLAKDSIRGRDWAQVT